MTTKHALTIVLLVSVLATLGAQSSQPSGDRQGADLRGGPLLAQAAAESLGAGHDDRRGRGRAGPRVGDPPAAERGRQLQGGRRDAQGGHVLRARAARARIRPGRATSSNSWGGPGQGYEWPESNHGITVDHKGNVWVGGNGDTDTHVLKFDRSGKFLLQIGKKGTHNGSNDTANLWRAAKIFVEPTANEAYIADGYGNHRVIVFDADSGQVQAALGRLRREAGRHRYRCLRSQGAAGQAVPDGALRQRLEGRARLRVRPGQRPRAGVPEGRHVRQGSVLRQGDAAVGLGVGHDVLARPAGDLHLHGGRREREGAGAEPRRRSRC